VSAIQVVTVAVLVEVFRVTLMLMLLVFGLMFYEEVQPGVLMAAFIANVVIFPMAFFDVRALRRPLNANDETDFGTEPMAAGVRTEPRPNTLPITLPFSASRWAMGVSGPCTWTRSRWRCCWVWSDWVFWPGWPVVRLPGADAASGAGRAAVRFRRQPDQGHIQA
jgi:hypothetical protein